jgi:regulator-associated protein of mTOR
VAAGLGDGKVKIYDLRTDRPVGTLAEHQAWVVLADFVKGDRELLTGALTGDIKYWDLRRMSQPLRAVEVGKGPMTAMAAHRTCPIMASG